MLSKPETQAAEHAGILPSLPPIPCDCDSDPIGGLKRLFVDFFQGLSIAAGRDPASRPVFLRQHGVLHGVFRVCPDLPAELRVGVFAQPTEHAAWVRLSSDVQPGNPDLKGTLGVAIKLFGVDGPTLLEPDTGAATHDFVLQNHDVFFVDTARDMCEFTCEALHGRLDTYRGAHPTTDRILNEMEKIVPSALVTPYWSVVPFRWGDGRCVKYKLEPEAVPDADAAPDLQDPTYLRKDLGMRMKKGPARFRFLVQLQTNDIEMPLDRATVRWSEEVSPPIHVATLTLPEQDIEARGQVAYGENLAFNILRALEAHAPQGSVAEARKLAYQASAERRRNVNGIPVGEPALSRPPQFETGTDYPAAKDRRIVRVAIHPAIGVARVGNSRDEYFIGPQVVRPTPAPLGFYRDDQGALKRQAVEFRLYGYNADGDLVREVTADWAVIRWSAHLANHKAAWYQWQMALDIPEAADLATSLRNVKLTDPAARATLKIDGGKQWVTGKHAHGVEFRGHFTGVPVYLGEMRTDEAGRLIILPGRGVSASPSGSPLFVKTDPNPFANSDGWYDDTADGPVTAIVEIEGRQLVAEPAWVVTAPPNYAPQVQGVRTLYDLLADLFLQAGWLQGTPTVSFRSDVYPLLQRLSGLQWVNEGFATQFGHNGRLNFDDPEFAARLSRKAATGGYDPMGEMRRQVFNSFRSPSPTDGNQLPWPWLYGDAMDIPAGNSTRQNATLSQTQHDNLRRWADGDFVDDWNGGAALPGNIDAIPLTQQPGMLDRAALEFCLADGFHPGCEVTWPIRHLSLYDKPFRIRHRPEGSTEPPLGRKLTQAAVLATNGPLREQGPGSLTRWMAVPWQADTAWCRAGYDTAYDPFAPSFWPARVPNQVLSAADYDVVIDTTQPPERRLEAFSQRTNWNEPLGDDTLGAMERMVRIFGSMGLVEVREGIAGDSAFPAMMQVASYGPDIAPSAARHPGFAAVEVDAVQTLALLVGRADAAWSASRQDLPRGANFASKEAAQQAPLPVRHPEK